MTRGIETIPNPELLVWARRSSGLSSPEAARRAAVTPERLEYWERGKKPNPTLSQLRKLASAYRRPIAVFYLADPPEDFTPIRDFRRLADHEPRPMSHSLVLAIREAHDRRAIGLDLYSDLEQQPPQPPAQVTMHEDPDALASRIRSRLSITRGKQVAFRDNYESLNWWRAALEHTGVLVFQVYHVAVAEMRGFSIADTPLPAIIMNSGDSPRGRLFTMVHEYVHVLLRYEALCDLDEGPDVAEAGRDIEAFCNRVAGATLVDRDDLLLEELVLGKNRGADWSEDEIGELAGKYKVSREVILRRLLICERIRPEFYQRKRLEYLRQYTKLSRSDKGFAPPDRLVISTAGPSFVALALEAYHSKRMTASDLADCLSVRLKHLASIEYNLTSVR